MPDDWEADVEDGDLQPVVYSEYMSPEKIADLLVSTNPDRVDTSVHSDFYTFLLQNMWRFRHDETIFETIVDAVFIRARPCSVRDLEEREQSTGNLTALFRVESEDRVHKSDDPVRISGLQCHGSARHFFRVSNEAFERITIIEDRIFYSSL